jgi:hypothetical protein
MLKAPTPAGLHVGAAHHGAPPMGGVIISTVLSLVMWALIAAIVLAVR